MSAVLDQIMIEDVSRNCPQQFLAFHRCVSKPPLEADCVDEQQNLSRCIKTEVPAFQKVSKFCAEKLKEYEFCLRTNKSAVSRCKADLESLRDCSFKAVSK